MTTYYELETNITMATLEAELTYFGISIDDYYDIPTYEEHPASHHPDGQYLTQPIDVDFGYVNPFVEDGGSELTPFEQWCRDEERLDKVVTNMTTYSNNISGDTSTAVAANIYIDWTHYFYDDHSVEFANVPIDDMYSLIKEQIGTDGYEPSVSVTYVTKDQIIEQIDALTKLLKG